MEFLFDNSYWKLLLGFLAAVAAIIIVLYLIFKVYPKIGAYVTLVAGSISGVYAGSYEAFVWSHETVAWLHKIFGIMAILTGVFFSIWLVVFIRADILSRKSSDVNVDISNQGNSND